MLSNTTRQCLNLTSTSETNSRLGRWRCWAVYQGQAKEAECCTVATRAQGGNGNYCAPDIRVVKDSKRKRYETGWNTGQ